MVINLAKGGCRLLCCKKYSQNALLQRLPPKFPTFLNTHQEWLIINKISQRKVIGDVAQYKRNTLSNDEYMDVTGPIIGNTL